MQANSWHKLFHLHLFFWIWKVWKEIGKIIKNWISWERKGLFRWKKHFSLFLKDYHLSLIQKRIFQGIKNVKNCILTLNFKFSSKLGRFITWRHAFRSQALAYEACKIAHAHLCTHLKHWRRAEKARLVWLRKLQGVWQITHLKQQRSLSFTLQRFYKKIMCI